MTSTVLFGQLQREALQSGQEWPEKAIWDYFYFFLWTIPKKEVARKIRIGSRDGFPLGT
jgi:hypothetical protein